MNIFVASPIRESFQQELEKNGFYLNSEKTRCEIILVKTQPALDRAFLDEFPALGFILRLGNGLDHIDLAYAHRRGVKVLNTPEASADSTAELSLLMLLLCARKLQTSPRSWAAEFRNNFPKGHQLKGKQLCIVGLGRIGSRLAQMAQGMGMLVAAYDPYLEAKRFQELQVEPVGFEEALKKADFLSLHCPLTAETHHLINSTRLNLMKPEAYLINCARGSLINEKAVLSALNHHQLAGLASDVFETEPPATDHPFFDHAKVVLSPHIGAFTDEAQSQIEQEALEILKKL